ncbi:hypothetical protein DPMN_179026 [Dreissena polymorpha]|uniref:Uncharacterized protein n=1 Tax=Dreissena polymorpha TaxID=45954 RepID=A0A9D4ED99_DREPO|nr:hypothetical protein DPMN_179026 [Dreissena polymorpha]
MRSLLVPVAVAVCTFLRYLASGDLQLTVGDSTGLSQATVSRVCAQVSDILASRVPVRAKQELGAITGL